MSIKDDSIYIEHILNCIDDVTRYVKGNRELFFKNDLVRNATLRQLQIMSESCSRISPKWREVMTEIDWFQIKGFRNILVHDYLADIDLEKIWEIIERRLPELKKAMEKTLAIMRKG